MFKIVRIICLAVVSLYCGLTVYIYAVQKSLIFHPSSEGTRTPKDFKLPYEDFLIPSFDSTKLHAWFVPHQSDLVFGKPISLLYCHGNGATLSRLAHVTKIFTEYGFEPTFFTYRGYGSSDKGALSETSIVGDAVAVYDEIKKRRPNQPIVAWGHSLGASVCAGVSTRRPLDALILEAPFASIPSMARMRYPWVPIIARFISDKFPTTDFVSHRMNASPLLIIHSQQDSIIPYGEGVKVFQAANEPKKFLRLESIDHNDFPSVNERYRPQITEWVKSLGL